MRRLERLDGSVIGVLFGSEMKKRVRCCSGLKSPGASGRRCSYTPAPVAHSAQAWPVEASSLQRTPIPASVECWDQGLTAVDSYGDTGVAVQPHIVWVTRSRPFHYPSQEMISHSLRWPSVTRGSHGWGASKPITQRQSLANRLLRKRQLGAWTQDDGRP